jgi:hypothetical protein
MCNMSAKKTRDGMSHDKFELRIDQREVIVCARRAGSLGLRHLATFAFHEFKWSGQDGRFRNHRGNYMKLISKALLAAAGMAALSWSPAQALEPGAGAQTKAGVLIGASAGVPPPGIYMINQVFTYQSNLTGPGVAGAPAKTGLHANVDVQAFLFVPGWTFLGGTVDFVIAQPFVDLSVSGPGTNVQAAGVHNTYFVAEDSWKLGTSGFVFKTGLGLYAPDGTVTGITGLGNQGTNYWTFQPEAILSYLKDGWNLSAAVYAEFNTQNTITNYTSGDILHADFTATKTIGKWTFGPVAYYVGQVSNDSCSSLTCTGFYGTGGAALTNNRYNVWAVGGLVAYDFGPAALSVWATQEVSAKASNNAAAAAGLDPSTVSQGMTVFATLSYRIWGPEETPKPVMFHK